VDGKVVKEIKNLNPESIDHISVIKDPDSEIAKKYHAKDGLIMITTKEGAELLSPKESKKVTDEAGASDDEPIFYVVEDMPEFPGGRDALKTYIYGNLEYPQSAKSKNIEGEVYVRFLVDELGKVRKEEIVRSSYEGFDEPALKVIRNMPDWKPGSQRGKAVKVWHVLAIKFTPPTK
jgi:TonB family protein